MQITKNLQRIGHMRGICADQIYIFCIYAKYVQITKYAECMHFAHMHSARMLHMCIVHIIIMRFAHMLYICQLHASFIYALCFNDIIINYVMHNNAQDIYSNIVGTFKYFYRSFCSFLAHKLETGYVSIWMQFTGKS